MSNFNMRFLGLPDVPNMLTARQPATPENMLTAVIGMPPEQSQGWLSRLFGGGSYQPIAPASGQGERGYAPEDWLIPTPQMQALPPDASRGAGRSSVEYAKPQQQLAAALPAGGGIGRGYASDEFTPAPLDRSNQNIIEPRADRAIAPIPEAAASRTISAPVAPGTGGTGVDPSATASVPPQWKDGGIMSAFDAPVPGMVNPNAQNFPAAPAPISQEQFNANWAKAQQRGQYPAAPAAPRQQQAQSSGPSGGDRFLGFLTGLGTGDNMIQGIANAINGAKNGMPGNQTVAYLTRRGMSQEDAQMVASNPQLLNSILTDMYKGKDPMEALKMRKMQLDIANAEKKLAGGGDDDTEYGLNPVWGQDANGNPALGVLGKNGSFKKVDTGNFNISTGTEQIDLGDSYAIKDKRSGQIIGHVPKNLAAAERDKVDGKSQGDALSTYKSLSSKLPGLEQVVSDLGGLADKATYTGAGQLYDIGRKQLGMEPRAAALARTEYIAMVDNQVLPMLRDTFGAAFTVKEGETLRSTLGDPDKSPAEKKAVLRSFINQKKRDIEALASQSGVAGNGPVGQPTGNKTKTGVTWSVE